MNTRLQVEHTITEYITGLDLVEEMINIAKGKPLTFKQDDIKIKGWAFESRIYAEDPTTLLPSVGRLESYIEPLIANDNSIRCDSGVVQGSEISMFYDPLICKLCTYADTRNEAMDKMKMSLERFVIQGLSVFIRRHP
jgi:propionyl-CoA carboxylase alpha chain